MVGLPNGTHAAQIVVGSSKRLPGVKAVLTGADLPYKLGLYMEDKDILARGTVRHQGEAVAAVALVGLETSSEVFGQRA